MAKKKKSKSSKQSTSNDSNEDHRWDKMKTDPRFLPVDGRLKVPERFAKIVESSDFPMLSMFYISIILYFNRRGCRRYWNK
jgi:hypothetical protein